MRNRETYSTLGTAIGLAIIGITGALCYGFLKLAWEGVSWLIQAMKGWM